MRRSVVSNEEPSVEAMDGSVAAAEGSAISR